MNNNCVRRKQRITALTLVLTMLMSGCGKEENSKFEIIENDNNELVVSDDSYISSEYISDYYVLEVYNRMRNENEIFIVWKRTSATRGYQYWGYFDIFSNIEIVNNKEDNEDMFSFRRVTSLKDYIVSYGLGQIRYSYEDMKNIYEVIKENYIYNKDNSLCKRRILDDRI